MSSAVRNILIAIAVYLLIAVFLGTHGGGPAGLLVGAPVAFFVWFIANNVSGNRKVIHVPPAERAVLIRTPPPPGHGLVYVYRDGILGMALGCNISVDGNYVAQLKSPRFTRVVVPAGGHTLEAAMNSFGGGKNNKDALSFTLAPGETLVFFTTIRRMAFGRRVVLERLAADMDTFVRLSGVTMVAPAALPVMVPPPPVRY
jgi:hypothetical protein